MQLHSSVNQLDKGIDAINPVELSVIYRKFK